MHGIAVNEVTCVFQRIRVLAQLQRSEGCIVERLRRLIMIRMVRRNTEVFGQ